MVRESLVTECSATECLTYWVIFDAHIARHLFLRSTLPDLETHANSCGLQFAGNVLETFTDNFDRVEDLMAWMNGKYSNGPKPTLDRMAAKQRLASQDELDTFVQDI